MMFLKILGVLFGILLISGGVQCIASPLETITGVASLVPVFIGCTLLVTAAVRFISWCLLKQEGEQDGFRFWTAILGGFSGLFLMGSWVLRTSVTVAVSTLIPYMIGILALLLGIIRIAHAITLKSVNDTVSLLGGHIRWGWELAFGILLIVAGIITLCNPISTLISVGVLIGADIVCCGINMIAESLVV